MLFKDSPSGCSLVLLLTNAEGSPPQQCFSSPDNFNILTNMMQHRPSISSISVNSHNDPQEAPEIRTSSNTHGHAPSHSAASNLTDPTQAQPERKSLLSSQDSTEPEEASSAKLASGRTVATRLGSFVMVTNVFAWILLLAAVAAISFLWFGGDANSNWRRVMIEGWIGRAVTLSSLAIRLAVVTQAGAAVAMLASISIEAKSGVALLEVPALSIARYTNTGPIMSTVTFWRNRNVPIFLAVAFLACTTLASQFTSTLLLWDVRSGSVLGFPTQKNLAVGIGLEDFIDDFSKLLVISPNYFTSPPTDFPTFAEWSEEPATLPEHISDTGATVRALLPIVNENDRAGVMDYNGTASLFDARVVCMRPNFTNWKFTMGEKNARGNYVPYGFKGNLALSDDIPESVAEVLRVNGTTPFHCTLDELVTLEGGRAFKVCVPSSSVAAGGLTSRIDPTQNNTLDYRYKDPFTSSSGWGAAINGSKRGWEIDVGHMVLLFDAEAPVNATNLASLIESFPDFVAEGSGVWMDYTSTSRPDNGTRVRVTACYDATEVSQSLVETLFGANCYDRYHQWFQTRLVHIQEFNIRASSKANHSEPANSWDPQSRSFDTRGLREQLGASSRPMNLSERGVMDLDMGRVDAAIKQYASEFSRNMSGPVTDPNTEWRVTLDSPSDAFPLLSPSIKRH